MTQAQIALGRLDDCLVRQIEAGRRLLEQLHLETAALQAGDAARVEQVLAPKQAALEDFAALDGERERLLREAGCGKDPEEVEGWIARGDPQRRPSMTSNWRRLLALAAECRQQNQVNGALIQAGLRHLRQVMDLLSGRPPGETAPYAPPQARRPEAAAGHSLGKA